MDIKYPIENKYMKCVLQINGFSGSRPRVRSNRWVELGGARLELTQMPHYAKFMKDILSKKRKIVEEGVASLTAICIALI